MQTRSLRSPATPAPSSKRRATTAPIIRCEAARMDVEGHRTGARRRSPSSIRDGDTVDDTRASRRPHRVRGEARNHAASVSRDLTLARLTPDLIYDQMIAGGVASEARVALARPPLASVELGAIRRRDQGPRSQTSHWPSRSTAASAWSAGTPPGASNLPFFPLRFDTSRPTCRHQISRIPADRLALRRRAPSRRARCKPDLTIVHAQRAPSRHANPRSGGCSAARRRRPSPQTASSSSSRSRRRDMMHADPNRTIIPGLPSMQSSSSPWGAHPS